MTNPQHLRVLAVDGGGTQCRIALQDGPRVVSVKTGAANVSTDFDGAVRQIADGLQELAEAANIRRENLARLPIFLGLAGVTNSKTAAQLRKALPFDHMAIKDDRPAALRGALGRSDGAIAHCGTGSFFAAQTNDRMRFSGGWGPILGDEASAQWIGRAALSATLEAVDGLSEMTDVAELFLERFDGAAGIVRFAGSARPIEFGALAPHVTIAAGDGDAMAISVMQSGAAEIARNLRRIGWEPGRAICLTGGIGPMFESYLPDHMRADVRPPLGEPITGALSIAADLAREKVQ